MRRVTVFNNVSVDGYFVDLHGQMGWARKDDEEWKEFAASNASGNSVLLFGRVTYELMASFWPTPMASKSMPVLAENMNKLQKLVFSRSLAKVTWSNTTLMKGDLAGEVRKLKNQPGPDVVILGSGSIVAQLASERLIDEYQIAVIPVVLGAGRTMFEGLQGRLELKLTRSRVFTNGNVLLCYESAV